MEKNLVVVDKVCGFVQKYAIYALAFLVPILFLPFTSDAFDFNKQTLIVVLVAAALFAWMIKVLISGRLEIKVNSVLIAVGLFFLAAILSTIFSANRYGSFWGWPQIASESLLSVSCLCILYFLASNIFSKKEIFNLAKIISISSILSGFISVLFMFFPQIGFGYANTLGSPASSGLFLAILLPLTMVFLIISKKWWKILFSVGVIISFLAFVLINYAVVWWVVLVGSALILIFSIFKKNFFDVRWMALPMFFVAVSVFFLVLAPQISWLPSVGNEIYLNQNSSFQIAGNVLKGQPVLGSGLGTFSYDFLKYKSADISGTSFWNVVFDRAGSEILTITATMGALGVLIFLAIVFLIIFFAAEFLFFGSCEDAEHCILVSGLLSCIVAQFLAYFLYSSNSTLDFVFFVLIALVAGFILEKKKEYVLKPNSFLSLFFVFLFTMIFIFGVGLIAIQAERYFAEVNYKNGVNEAQKGNIDGAIADFQIAAGSNSASDLYFAQLSQAYILKINNDLQNSKLTNDQKTKEIQTLSANAINAAKIATDLDPQSANDWSVRGFIYQNLIGVSADMEAWAEKSYQQAITLDPNNPYLHTQLGILFYQKQDYANSLKELQTATGLNADYGNALYYLGLVYDAQNQKDKAISEFTTLLSLNPTDTNIPKIIANLKAGRSALDNGVAQPAVASNPQTQPPTKNAK